MDKDYDEFVKRMGSFDMDISEIPQKEEQLTHFVKITNDNIMHVGVKGMHWGVRRATTSTGPSVEKHKMTTEKLGQVKKVTDHSSKITEEGGKITKSIGGINRLKNQEDISQMTDSELQARVKRLNMEQQYNQLTSNQITKGQAYAKNALDIGGSVLAIGSSAIGIALAINQLKGN